LNICFPSLSYPLNGDATSGVGSQVRMLAHSMIDNGNSVSVIDLAESEQLTTRDDRGAEVHRVRCGNLHWYAAKLPFIGSALALPIRELEYSAAVWRGVRAANKQRPIDLIEGTETGMFFVALFGKQLPLVIRLHGEQYTFHKYTPGLRLTFAVRLSRSLQRFALRRARLLISPSYAHAREIQNEFGPSRPPIVVVPNGFNSERCDAGIERTPQTVLYVGRIARLKGIATLLEAAAQTRKTLPDSRFIFAGDFHSSLPEAEFRALVSSYGLEENVQMLGPVGWQVLSSWYQRSAVSVLPSYYETFGLAALEPMAFGTPVIATSGGALSEVVESDVSGKLVTAGDANALAVAMTNLLADDKSRAAMGRAAVNRAATFDVDRLQHLNARHYEWCTSDTLADAESHLFFSPHLDDAVLSCGGTIHSLVSQNKSVSVITVFAGDSDEVAVSPFARHLHAKWGSPVDTPDTSDAPDIAAQRRLEDVNAFRELGVDKVERWDFVEAPYRRNAAGTFLYTTYDELRNAPASEEAALRENIAAKIRLAVEAAPAGSRLYFPLALGQHVDHRLLFEIGLALSAKGKPVHFYEDYPYAEAYQLDKQNLNWLPQSVPVSLASKVKAASAYITQLPGLGGSVQNLERRLRAFSSARTKGRVSERYWEFVQPSSAEANAIDCPLVLSQPQPTLRDFKKFLQTFRWHDLKEVLPAGAGRCLDVGCGIGRYQALITDRGYQWLGIDNGESSAAFLKSDAASLPLPDQSVAAFVGWQVFEYLAEPEKAFAEAARVLEFGGVFCGSVSFLEPVHGRSYFNLSPLALKHLLAKHGFADLEIKPGLNGFALLFWTWLRRSGIPLADRLAVPLAFILWAPVAALLFLVSWLGLRTGMGSGHIMRWISQTVPLDFAGHLMFSARKKARTPTCT
jgi:glycosyltransferase involved in cell wall biosynthesis/LmbE family N-acetylglucosaminyl deacetylase